MKKMLLTFRSLIISIIALSLPINSVWAQVVTLQNWTNIYHGTSSSQQDINYTIETGTNEWRILVVGITSARKTSGTMSVTLSYGGQPLTLINGDMGSSTKQHSAIYYLNEAGIDAATSSTLSVTVSGGVIANTDVWASVFDQVAQVLPITDSKMFTSGSSSVTSFLFSTPLSVSAYDQAVEVISTHNSLKNQPSIITYGLNWTKIAERTATYSVGFSGFSIRNGTANRSIPPSSTTDNSASSLDRAALVSMTAVSLHYQYPPPPTIPASNVIFSDVGSSSFTISWTNGDGTNRLVLLKAGSAVDASPVDGITYTASNLFGSGSQIGTGNYVIYNGTGNSVTVNNLTGNTMYHAAVFEFSGPAGIEDYLTTNPARGSQLTTAETAQNGDYRTKTSGNWGTPATWESFNGSIWVDALVTPSSSDGIITIRTGHTVTAAENVTADQVVVEPGGQVTVNTGIILTINDAADDVDFNVQGTIANSGIIAVNGILAFTEGAVYRHNEDGGTVPAATWDPASTCMIKAIVDTSPSGLGQTFGNLIWDCPSQQNIASINTDMTVQGDLSIANTGTESLAITDDNNSRTVTVSGNYYQTGGVLNFNAGSSSTATGYLNVAGDFSFTSGGISEASSGRGSVVFNGGGTVQTFTSGGFLTNTIDFTVESGSWLQMGSGAIPSYITGSSGTFTLDAGSTLGITDRYGITLSTTGSTGGNIRVTGTRTFSGESTYIYNGSVNQNTGIGLPETINTLVFDNTTGIVTFNSARNITEVFSITTGSKANLGTYTHSTLSLVLGGTGQQAGSYGHSNSPATFKNDIFFDNALGIVNNNSPSGTWLGITPEWHEATNWVGGIPTSSSALIISSLVAFQPVISGTATAQGLSVLIGLGASLTIGPAGSATFTSLTNNGTLNLNSDASGTASLILDSYTDNGTENIELFLTGGEAGAGAYRWHYISSPVTPSIPASVFEAVTPDLAQFIEGNYTGTGPEGWIASDGYIYATGSYGTRFYDLILGKGYNYYNGSDFTFTFDGALNTSALNNISLLYSGTEPGSENSGFNLLGNPFSSGLSWDVISNLPGYPQNTSKAVFFTKDNVQYTYVNGVGTPAGANGNIPPMQGFFVKTYSTGNTFSLPLEAREHNSTPRYKGAEVSIPLVGLSISENGESDETVIRFDEKAGQGIDLDFDAVKMTGISKIPSISSVNGTTEMIINGMPFPATEVEIPLSLRVVVSGNKGHTISASRLQGLDDYDVILSDKTLNKKVDLKKNSGYTFNSTEGFIAGRFSLKIFRTSAGNELLPAAGDKFRIYNMYGIINIIPLADDWDMLEGSVRVTDIRGLRIIDMAGQEFRKGEVIQVKEPQRTGIYFIEIRSGMKRYSGKLVVK